MFYLTWKLRNVENEDFPRLRIQIKLNLFVVPIMFLSSIVLHGFAQIWIHSGGDNPLQYLLLSSIFDQMINSMIMYVTIYVDDTWAIASFLDLGFVDFLSPHESSSPSFPYEKKIKEEKFWIQVKLRISKHWEIGLVTTSIYIFAYTSNQDLKLGTNDVFTKWK